MSEENKNIEEMVIKSIIECELLEQNLSKLESLEKEVKSLKRDITNSELYKNTYTTLSGNCLDMEQKYHHLAVSSVFQPDESFQE